MIRITLIVLVVFSQTLSFPLNAAERLCLENVCIGDDVDALDVEWKNVKVDYKIKRSVKALLLNKTVDDLYYEYNEILVTDKKNSEALIPYIIQLKKFDSTVLNKLAKVKAICTSLSLTGEVMNDSVSKLLVTFRAVADQGGRGRLRVVQIEKEFNIYPPHLRPNDKERYISMVQTLQAEYPSLVQQRDIDARALTNEAAFAAYLIGFRFYTDINSPLVFRIRDLADIESIDYDPQRSASCPELE
jgi:hypothetical protein